MFSGQNGRHFGDDIFKCIFINFDSNFTEVCSQRSNWQYSSIGSDNAIKPLFEPMLTQFTDAYMRHKGEMS